MEEHLNDFTAPALDMQFQDVKSKSGKIINVPAIHFGFVEKREYVNYRAPSLTTSLDSFTGENISNLIASAAREEWLERMFFMIEDLQWLLRLSHQRFWCQVIYDLNLQKCLASYLQNAPRFYDLHNLMITSEMENALQTIHKLVFLAYLRMSTYKESKTAHISREVFGTYIYDKFLFDIPILLDLCVLYGQENPALLSKMMENIFICQPCYNQDLYLVIPTILEAFNSIVSKLGLREASSILVHSPCMQSSTILPLSWPELQDTIQYVVDLAITMGSLIDIYPPSSSKFQQHQAEPRIASFYETVFEPLETDIEQRKVQCAELQMLLESISKRIQLAKHYLIKAFRDILVFSYIHPLLDSMDGNSGTGQHFADNFLQIMSTVLSEKRFICDYQLNFPFEEDLQLINQSQVEVDSMQTTFILKSISAYTSSKNSQELTNGDITDEVSLISIAKRNLDQCVDHKESNGVVLEGATSVNHALDKVKMDSLISHVLDVFPDLGNGFIQMCLEYYNYETEKVINSLLEENLPAALKSLDRKLTSSKEDVKAVSKPLGFADLLTERKNIFDNDEMDIFSKDVVDTSKIHKGKRQQVSHNLDKDAITKSKATYKKYEMIIDNIYEDEYDDTYDDATTAWGEEPSIADEIAFGRKFTIPRVLRKADDPNSADDDDTDDEEEVVDAEVPLEEKEKEVLAQPDKRKKDVEPKNFYASVKGKPRGQGQEDKTIQSRRFKEQHKGTFSNHNRKNQSGRKMMGGMMNR